MKIKLKKDHSIRGVVEKKGSEHDIHKGVADDLIKRGIAEKPIDQKSDK
jgi:hypothetical protein